MYSVINAHAACPMTCRPGTVSCRSLCRDRTSCTCGTASGRRAEAWH